MAIQPWLKHVEPLRTGQVYHDRRRPGRDLLVVKLVGNRAWCEVIPSTNHRKVFLLQRRLVSGKDYELCYDPHAGRTCTMDFQPER